MLSQRGKHRIDSRACFGVDHSAAGRGSDSRGLRTEDLHPAVVHYRAIADRERSDRERRFNR